MGSIYDPFDTPLNLPLINKICNFVYSGMEERLCRMFMFTMMSMFEKVQCRFPDR